MALLVSDIINLALYELNTLAQGETPDTGLQTYVFNRLNLLLDEWSARKPFAYAVDFNVYTLQANLSPHTIGPSGATFTVTQRPNRLEGADLILNTTPTNVDIPLNVRDEQWWLYERVKSLTSSIPTDVYYSPQWPNGQLFFWPVPTFAYQVRLETWTLINQFSSVSNTVVFPPGYQNALMLTLATQIAAGVGGQLNPATVENAKRALKAIQSNNMAAPRTTTVEAGQPRAGRDGVIADFNWANGGLSNN